MLVTLETFSVKCKFPCLSRIEMILKVRFIKAWLLILDKFSVITCNAYNKLDGCRNFTIIFVPDRTILN